MVCIIDDREDVWTYANNLVHVQPYNFFKNAGDINDPHGVKKANNKKDDPEVNGPERRLERRQSIDMPSIDDKEEVVEEKEVEDKDDKIQDDKIQDDDVSMVSDDLELSDDDSNDAKPTSKKEAEKPGSKFLKISFFFQSHFFENLNQRSVHSIHFKSQYYSCFPYYSYFSIVWIIYT